MQISLEIVPGDAFLAEIRVVDGFFLAAFLVRLVKRAGGGDGATAALEFLLFDDGFCFCSCYT
jgi:hypothetical protein